MIITVTFNPAADKTARVKKLEVGGLNRLEDVVSDAGGKGINVSKTIKALEEKSICTGFIAGSTGSFIKNTLKNLEIPFDFTEVAGNNRTNLKVLNEEMELTEFNEAGPSIEEKDIKKLLEKMEDLVREKDVVVLSGNVSLGVSSAIYKRIIERLQSMGVQTILDADGKLLKEGLKANPTAVKPNRYELLQYFGKEEASLEELIAMAKSLLNEKTKLVVVSMGLEGSLFIDNEQNLKADALKIDYKSSVGAGDAMVAAMAIGLDKKMPLQDLALLAVAVSAGACLSEGTSPADKKTVDELMKKVNLEKLV